MKKRAVGIHVRLKKGMIEGLEKASSLGMTVYQSFLMDEAACYFNLSPQDIQDFIRLADEKKMSLVVHAGYWSNITKSKSRGFSTLKNEAETVTKLNQQYVVVHSGTIKGMSDDPVKRAKKIAAAVDQFHDLFPSVQLLIENSPHGGLSYGGDLQDFSLMLKHIKNKDRVGFCIDTAHAHAYGYDIVDDFDGFMRELDETIGFSCVKIIHLNDTVKKRGSRIDKHGLFGEGVIGQDCLKKFVQYKPLEHAIIILELPTVTEQQEVEALDMVNQWVKETV